jgi:alkylation response protein AidB-like acyl-CoA dehydrogenase
MALFLNDDQAMLRDTARAFMGNEAPVAHLRQLRDAEEPTGFSRTLWREFAAMGFTGILVPEAAGGLGLGHVEAGVVLEEIGRNLTPSPFLSTAVAATAGLAGTAHAERWGAAVLAGEAVIGIAVDERAKHDGQFRMRAERAGNGYRLSGTKRLVVHGHLADLLLVAADTDAGVALFAVPGNATGLNAEPLRLVDAGIAATLRFDDVLVDADAVVGEIGGEDGPLARLLAAGRVGAAAELLGVGGGAMERTVDYLKQRRQFGVVIGSFQALQHRAAHLYSELELARAAVLKAQQLLDAGEPATEAVHVAKAMAGMAATLAVQESIQMHGGIGMTDDHDIGFFMKRARVLAELFGDVHFHADALARAECY